MGAQLLIALTSPITIKLFMLRSNAGPDWKNYSVEFAFVFHGSLVCLAAIVSAVSAFYAFPQRLGPAPLISLLSLIGGPALSLLVLYLAD
jgi:hypothetical protein